MSEPNTIPLVTYPNPDAFGLKGRFDRLGTALSRPAPPHNAQMAGQGVHAHANNGERTNRSVLKKIWGPIKGCLCCWNGGA
ncbi:unnamed protein product [Peniophora sp. CBMAI 1063]|nr:unnamed protein product [Peniophora sp. CBMAI 1063]